MSEDFLSISHLDSLPTAQNLSPREVMGKPTGRKATEPTFRIAVGANSFWGWIHQVSATSPIQPILNLGTGLMEYNPPEFIQKAHAEALSTVQNNQYAPIAGTAELRKALADVYSPLYGRQLSPMAEVLVSSGAQEGLLSSVMAFVDSDDEVIVFEPVFEMYVYQIKMAGGIVKPVLLNPPSGAEDHVVSANDWTIDMAELEAATSPRTKMIYFNNPHNPTGKVFSRAELLNIGNFCVKHDLLLLSDEVYERIAFDNPPDGAEPSTHIHMASLSPQIAARTLTAGSLGKLFNASGWRLEFVIGPQSLIDAVEATHITIAYSSSSPAQTACAQGLRIAGEQNWWRHNAKDLETRCKMICNALDGVGLTARVSRQQASIGSAEY